MRAHDRLSEIAKSYLGTLEEGANKGHQVELFQRCVDGKAQGEPWCMAFVQFCLNAVESELGHRSNLYSSEHCLTVWEKTPQELRSKVPLVGSVVLWRKKGTTQGHTGVVTEVLTPGSFRTAEGNTNDGSGINRDGDGVYARVRTGLGTGDFEVLGFLDPFHGWS